MSYNMVMRVSSVLLGSGVYHIPKQPVEPVVSEFAYLPEKNCHKPYISDRGFKQLLVGTAVIAVALTLSRLKMPLKKEGIHISNFANILKKMSF